MVEVVYDLCGIGIGPANLSLASLLVKDGIELTSIFLEKKVKFDWHPGVMLPGTKLQVPFLADLVTLIDPTSPFSFLNYLCEHNRLYKFYFLEDTFLYRQEYENYCNWAVSKLNACTFDRQVISLEFVEIQGECVYKVMAINQLQQAFTYYAKNIVIGVGSTPCLPDYCINLDADKVFHTSQFLTKSKRLAECEKIVVVGAGQSAAECVLEILNQHGSQLEKLHWLTRSDGFFPMESSALGLEHFSPEYMTYFSSLNNEHHLKEKIIRDQKNIYKGISLSTLKDIYQRIYQLTMNHEAENFVFSSLREVTNVINNHSLFEVSICHAHKKIEETIEADAVIFGTGYEYKIPIFLNEIKTRIVLDSHDDWQVNLEFQLALDKPSSLYGNIYIQNGEIRSHGIGSPDLGLSAYRSAKIINQLCKKNIYNIPIKSSFQSWDILG